MKKVAFISILGLVLIAIPLVVERPYVIHLFIMSGIYSIIVLGVLLQFKLGLWNLGAAAFWGIGAYSSALLTRDLGLSFWLSLPLAALITAACALCLGSFFLRAGRVSFLLLTMVLNGVFVEIVGHWELMGGWEGIPRLPKPIIYVPFIGRLMQFVTKTPYYYLLLFLLLMIIVAFYALYSSRIGRTWGSIGLNSPLAAMLGVNVFRYKLLAFIAAAASAGIAGCFYAHYQGFLVPRMFDMHESFYFMLYGVVGGLAYPIAGAIVGSFIGVAIPELLRVGGMFQAIFFGIILILVILFAREGVAGLLAQVYPTIIKGSKGVIFSFLRELKSLGNGLRFLLW
jgi:branched-chain amino acid transport system permease protein